MITKTVFDAKLSNLNKKITSNKTNHLVLENELKKLKTFDLGYFIGKNHFDEDGAQKLFSISINVRVNGLQNGTQKDYLTKVLKLFLKQTIL